MMRSRMPSSLTQRSSKPIPEQKKVVVPYFCLECINSEYPKHLIPGEHYYLKPNDKDIDGNIPCHWKFEGKKIYIGNFPLKNFNTEPVRRWVEFYKKGK